MLPPGLSVEVTEKHQVDRLKGLLKNSLACPQGLQNHAYSENILHCNLARMGAI